MLLFCRCVFDMTINIGRIMNSVHGMTLAVLFIICAISYIILSVNVMISSHIMTSGHALPRYEAIKGRRLKSVRIMMVFILVFLLQWWPWSTQAIWSRFTQPPNWLMVCVVLFCNLGGVLNAFAYTFLRRKHLLIVDNRIVQFPRPSISTFQ